MMRIESFGGSESLPDSATQILSKPAGDPQTMLTERIEDIRALGLENDPDERLREQSRQIIARLTTELEVAVGR
jgi:hypothetical protein